MLNSFGSAVDWNTIGIFIQVGILGSLIGNVVSQRINQRILKRAFAGFLVVMGLFVLGREVPHLLAAGTTTAELNSTDVSQPNVVPTAAVAKKRAMP